MYNPIKLMVEAFDAHGLKYRVDETDRLQVIHAGFGVRNGPTVDVQFISAGERNDVMVRIVNLVNNVPAEKRGKLLEVCNTLNNKYRFFKFNMNPDNNILVEYDLPVNTGNDCLGEAAFEIFVRIIQILNENYIVIAKALYIEDEPAPDGRADPELLKLLKDNHDEINIKISKTAPSGEDGKE